MKRAIVTGLAAGALLLGTLPAVSAQASPPPSTPSGDAIGVYVADLTPDQFKTLRSAHLDHEDVAFGKSATKGRVRVEVVISALQVRELAKKGLALTPKKLTRKMAARRVAPRKVFRPYSGRGGLREELGKVAASRPNIAKTVVIGKSVQGKPITAVRVSRNVRTLKDRQRPAVVYQGAQHAREWITPEMIRRLLHQYVGGYGRNAEITKIVDTTDLWFIPVVNVDGYDHTFTADNRLWRKNLRDNDGDGKITGQDGVDPNRNFPYKWGYDNEGSDPYRTGETYRGPRPGSEPETQAQIALAKRLRPKFLVNYHSAAQLLLYGVGWQSLTSSPDDVIHQAILGDIDKPAVPGYNPQLGAQLYVTNGDTDGHMENKFGVLSQTPEMSTCETASAIDPNDEWRPEDCESVFNFPDDEKLVQGEFKKNLRYALDTAKSAQRPDRPVSPVGRTTPDFKVDRFGTSYGSSQAAASVIRRSLRDKRMHYRINGRRAVATPVREWQGGERFGDENHHYYGEFRGTVRGQKAGDRVEVWFSGKQGSRQVASGHFTYRVRSQQDAKVLVVADEDYKGVNPKYPAGTNAPKYARQYVDAIKANGVKPLVWDIDKDGVPHDLGVLKHFKAVVWYLGDNRLTQDPADEPVHSVVGDFPDSQVADRAKDLTLNVRSYLNEGGKLLYTGETTSYYGPLVYNNGGGIYYGLKGHPEKPCYLSSSFTDDCEILADDFSQYYLGVNDRVPMRGVKAFSGFRGFQGALPGTAANPVNEPGGFEVTSTVLPPSKFPQFRSWKAGDYNGVAGPYEPFQGAWYVAGSHQDDLYRRLTRTIDLTSVTAAQAPTLQAQLSWDTEGGFDNAIVEAHTAGQQDWTTLPDKNGRSTTTVPAQCERGFLIQEHPFLSHYLTAGNPCKNTGSSGKWNAFTGNSGGWVPTAFDLSAYAGKKVEVSIAYVTDGFTGGKGLFIDSTKVTRSTGTLDSADFESGLGPWAIKGAPAGSPGNQSEFARSRTQIDSVAAVATPDTITLGFGVEQLKTAAERKDLMARALRHLLR